MIEVVKLIMRSGSGVDSIQMLLSDGTKSVYSPKVGGNGGGETTWAVPPGETITQVEYGVDGTIVFLQFITNKGNKSPHFGGNGGSYSIVTFPEGFRIIGFYGRFGNRMDKLGFILGKTVYPSSLVEEIKVDLEVQ